MIEVLNNWMLESSQNFNMIVGLTMVMYVGSIAVLIFIGKKFGRPDERTNTIYFKITSCMFMTQLIMNSIFISLVDRDIDYFRQFFLLFQGIVFVVGAIYSYSLYKKDFK
ncbi:6-aminohexanoate hydrolase [Radiobacillus deserti]|uniref:6-aminohexanoate hydrolase n=1 Tax=Radiobacillus deserti TaxID=2594883 RepID=A0A516KFW6_9BACI|nr:6-aminohexanoate hydrolase [Radiobacillus deserti]QDP40266.1 6-aminohexanoate hydrolase [Radiobacillus deserti]